MEIKSFSKISEEYFKSNDGLFSSIPNLVEETVLTGIEQGEERFWFTLEVSKIAPVIKETIFDMLTKAGYTEIVFQEKVQGSQKKLHTKVFFKSKDD